MAPRQIKGTTAAVTPYDGCGKCFVATRRLSRVKGSTSSPGKQEKQTRAAVAAVGGHIIAWADDWEVSGAINPLDRPALGPWLRGERGPFDGLAGAAVDRIGRNVRDVLNTEALITEAGRHLVTADHEGIWDLTDPAQENDFMLKAWGSQMELRNIQRRNRDESKRAVDAGQISGKPSYGYRHVRPHPSGKVTHAEFDPDSQPNIQEVARRILADATGRVTAYTEAARLTRAGVLSPADRLAVLYGREPEGKPWLANSLAKILTSEAALGYRMHQGRPLLGDDGRPVRIAPPLWDRATHQALKKKLAPTPRAEKPEDETPRAPKGTLRLSGLITCGNCAAQVHRNGCVSTKEGKLPAFRCDARFLGIPSSQDCKPAPSIGVPVLDAMVESWFLHRFGAGQIMVRFFDPGTGFADQIDELKAAKQQLRDDRAAGLYKSAEDTEWFRSRYDQLDRDIAELEKQPERPAGWCSVPSGQTVADKWRDAADDAERREMLDEYGVKIVLFPVWGRGRADRVVITADVEHDPTAEVVAAVEGDQSRPEAEQHAEAPQMGRTAVRITEPATVRESVPVVSEAPTPRRRRARPTEPALAA